jgi:hypothetical protein
VRGPCRRMCRYDRLSRRRWSSSPHATGVKLTSLFLSFGHLFSFLLDLCSVAFIRRSNTGTKLSHQRRPNSFSLPRGQEIHRARAPTLYQRNFFISPDDVSLFPFSNRHTPHSLSLSKKNNFNLHDNITILQEKTEVTRSLSLIAFYN